MRARPSRTCRAHLAGLTQVHLRDDEIPSDVLESLMHAFQKVLQLHDFEDLQNIQCRGQQH